MPAWGGAGLPACLHGPAGPCWLPDGICTQRQPSGPAPAGGPQGCAPEALQVHHIERRDVVRLALQVVLPEALHSGLGVERHIGHGSRVHQACSCGACDRAESPCCAGSESSEGIAAAPTALAPTHPQQQALHGRLCNATATNTVLVWPATHPYSQTTHTRRIPATPPASRSGSPPFHGCCHRRGCSRRAHPARGRGMRGNG